MLQARVPVKHMPRQTTADPIAAKIGDRIRALRIGLGLTQEKLSYEVEGAPQRHRKGLIRPTIPTLVMLAERLEVDLLDVMTFPEDSPRQRLVDLTRRMKPGTIRRLIRDAGD